MDKLAFVGFVLMLAVIPLMQYSLDNYKQYLSSRGRRISERLHGQTRYASDECFFRSYILICRFNIF